MIFLLKEKATIDLSGKRSSIVHRIEHQTEKAILLAVAHTIDGEEKSVASYWLPKSQILVNGERPGPQMDVGKARKIEIPDWLWKERKAVA